jgi:uncharacterized protein (TIGR02594 family)
MTDMDAFSLAAQQIGLNERDKKAALSEYLANGGVNLDPAVTAWCAAYVNATLAQTGQKGTGSNMARSFLDWGQEVSQPQRGDLAVFSRGDPNGPFGHVGFFDGYNEDGTIRVLGGNQSDAVSIASYSPDQLLGFRRGGDGGSNALAAPGVATAGATGQAEGNALAAPEFQWTYSRLDPQAFMRPIMPRNSLSEGLI